MACLATNFDVPHAVIICLASKSSMAGIYPYSYYHNNYYHYHSNYYYSLLSVRLCLISSRNERCFPWEAPIKFSQLNLISGKGKKKHGLFFSGCFNLAISINRKHTCLRQEVVVDKHTCQSGLPWSVPQYCNQNTM